MKHSSFVLLLSVFISLFACSSDDYYDLNDVVNGTVDSDIDLNGNINGTWLLTSFNVSNAIDINEDGTANENLIEETNCYTNETLLINNDGTAVSTTNSFLDITVDLVAGTTNDFDITFGCVQETESENLTWVSNGSEFTFTDQQNIDMVFTLNGDTLRTFVPDGFLIFNADGTEVTVTQDITFIYTRQ